MIHCRECHKIYLHYKVYTEVKGLLVEKTWDDKGYAKDRPYLDSVKNEIIDFEADDTYSREYECLVNGNHTIKPIETDLYRQNEDIDYVLSLVHDYEIDLSKLSVEDAFKLKQLLFPEGGIK